MRAPEVFLGYACTEPSQVWAVAAMLLCWIKPGILGECDSPHSLIDKAWSMAKVKRLFPNWNIPPPEEVDGDTLKAAVNSARRISREEPEMQAISPLEDETRKVDMPHQLRDLLRLMLKVDPSKRPSALSILESREFMALEKMASV
jgi:serine/threonine protein kinase